MVHPSNLILFQQKLECRLLALQSYNQKNTSQRKIHHYRQNDKELAVVTFEFLHKSRVKEFCAAKARFALECLSKHGAF